MSLKPAVETIKPQKTSSCPVNSKDVTELNGVSLVTNGGKWKQRFSKDEKLQMCGATQKDLDFFIKTFCNAHPKYALTKAGEPRSWTTPRNHNGPVPIDENVVLRHLVGNAIPTMAPIWVAPRGTKYTEWVGVDIDNQSDPLELQQRLTYVEKSLILLGIRRDKILKSRTPSGGWHFRFFIKGVTTTVWAHWPLYTVGIEEQKGTFELFPSEKQGMRLPFGFIPGDTFDPNEWVRFVRNLKDGNVHRFQWNRLLNKAKKIKEAVDSGKAEHRCYRRLVVIPPPPVAVISPNLPANTPGLGRSVPAANDTEVETNIEAEYEQSILKIRSNEDAESILKRGIGNSGERTELTRKLGWHLHFAKGLPKEKVVDILSRWVYATGAHTSADVMKDLKNGTRHVHEQIVHYVEWLARVEKPAAARFAKAEVDWILFALAKNVTSLKLEVAEFALRILHFLRGKGQRMPTYWGGAISAGGVMRNFPGCDRSEYKWRRDELESAGLLRLIRRKRQSGNGTGRPQTYALAMPPQADRDLSLSFDEALEQIKDRITVLRSDYDELGKFVSNEEWSAFLKSGERMPPSVSWLKSSMLTTPN